MAESGRAGTPWSLDLGTLHKPEHPKAGNPGRNLCISREPREKPLHKIIQVSMMPPVFFYNTGNIRRRYFLCGGQAEYCTARTGGGSYDLSG